MQEHIAKLEKDMVELRAKVESLGAVDPAVVACFTAELDGVRKALDAVEDKLKSIAKERHG